MLPARIPNEINGINLADYVPNEHCYNSVVYVHKRLLQQPKPAAKVEKKVKEFKERKPKKGKHKQCDKCQQYVNDLVTNNAYNDIMAFNNAVMEHNLQYANTTVPVVIPPSGIISPVYYNIKATKKFKKKLKPDSSYNTYKKEKSKKIVETYRNEKVSQKESLSVKETISYVSQSDTLDELNMNPSLCCTFSDVSEQKQVKREKRDKHDKQAHELRKLTASESFEALATEFLNTSGDTKIKIHLMNETEKSLFTENIRVPLLNAIKEGIIELKSQAHSNDVGTVQKYVQCNSRKLDAVIDKLTCIERKLDKYFVRESAIAKTPSPRIQVAQASTLERLGEDILELKENSSEEEYFQQDLSARKKAKCRSTVVQLQLDDMNKKEKLGGGEDPAGNRSGSQLAKLERPHRLPARFCWTDTDERKNTT